MVFPPPHPTGRTCVRLVVKRQSPASSNLFSSSENLDSQRWVKGSLEVCFLPSSQVQFWFSFPVKPLQL